VRRFLFFFLAATCKAHEVSNACQDEHSLLSVHRAKQVNHDKDSFTLGSTGTTTTDQVKWHSQKGQDEWVFEMLGQKHGGFFIDLAVNKPVLYSNTISLEEQYDWKGICIDANPEYVRRCKEKRSCIVLQAAVDCVSGRDVEFAMRDELGGVIDENADNKPGTQTDEKLVHFKTRTLANLLEATGAPKIIDYLSLDIEGFEYRALVAFPFDKYRFRALTIERPPPWLNAVLLKNGYVWMRNKLFDSFYVHYSEVAALQAAQRHNLTEVEQVPSKCDGKAGTSCEWSSEAPELPFCTGK